MPTITVLDKIYGPNSVASFEKNYINLIDGLEVQIQLKGKNDRGWMQLDVSGNDTQVALNLLDQKIGLAPNSLDELQKFSVLKGKIVSLDKKNQKLHVDIGITFPKPIDATISEKNLQAQLTDGKQISIEEIVELFCLFDNVPVEIRLAESVKEKCSTIKAVLSDRQILLFQDWVSARFDRLIILGSSLSKVERAIKWSRVFRDVIKTETLGTLEHVVLCKLGTDAIGLIPRIGRYMKSSVNLIPFSPKKIIKKIDSGTFDD